MKKRITAFLMAATMLATSAGAKLSVEDARALVERLYIDEVPQEVLDRPTVEEIFDGLDQYSSYFTPEQYEAFLYSMNDVSGVGLGIVSSMSEDGSCLEISKVLTGGAAEKAGLEPGDQIFAVDGNRVADAGSLEETAAWMRGEEGTKVALTLRRKDGTREELILVRAPYTVPYTEHELIDGHIGYISCTSVGNETYGHFIEALDDIGPEVDRWVLDLRENTGGVTSAAAETVGIFTGQGNQALMRGRDGTYYGFSASGERTTIEPVIVLVGEHTASAAELMAASIRDNRAGLIIGGRTYGKGVAQTLVDQTVEPEMFADGDAVRITSNRFYSPLGLTNDQVGVIPHLLVADEYAGNIAYLLSHSTPTADNEGIMRLHLGAWRWYLSLDQALNEEEGGYRPAFVELLEAVWPDAALYLGTGENGWERVTAAQIAQRFGLEEYTPRTFSDVEDSPYQYALNVWKTYGVLQGDENGGCDPEGVLTRAQLCQILANLLQCGSGAGTQRFRDVAADAWYAPAVDAIASLGLIQGDGSGAFRPDEILTNEQLIVVLARMMTWMSVNMYELEKTGPAAGELEAEALKKYSEWAKESAWLMGLSQKNIYGNYISYMWTAIEEIEPQASATREVTAHSMWRIMDILGILVE